MSFAFNKSNATVVNGQVNSSSIDMDGGVISTHGTPTSTTDVVNKSYCDANSAAIIPSNTIVLSGVAWTLALSNQTGDFVISIKNVVTNGPCAKWSITKNSASRYPSIVRFNSIAGSVTFERLELRWNLNSGIEIRKNNTNYDGEYRLSYVGNL